MPPPTTATAAPQQHKQTSRKGKKAWRKNVDLTEVQDGLEAVRDEVTRTGGVIAEKASSELFAIDTAGSDDIRKKVPKTLKPLKSDQIIGQRSAVPAVNTHKRTTQSGTTDGIIEPRSKRRKGNGVSHKELQRLKQRAYGGEAVQKDIVRSANAPTEDPWMEKPVQEDPDRSFLPKSKDRVAPKTLREAPVSLLESGKAMPAVAKPNPGISYNPQFDDYEKLIQREGDREVIAETKRLQEAAQEAELRARIEAAEAEAAEKSEYYTEDESVWEGIESGVEGSGELKKKRPQRKTPAERNKIKRRKAAEREVKHLARMEQRGRRGLRTKGGDAALQLQDTDGTEEQVVQAEAPDSSDDEIDDRKLRRRKLGAIAVPEKPLELVLADELQDSLRLLKPEGNLLKERFRNYLVGGKVETRRPGYQAKKARRKATEKWTYKDFSIPT